MYMYMYIFQLIYPGLTYLVQKTKGFLTFSGGIEMWHWTKWVKVNVLEANN